MTDEVTDVSIEYARPFRLAPLLSAASVPEVSPAIRPRMSLNELVPTMGRLGVPAEVNESTLVFE